VLASADHSPTSDLLDRGYGFDDEMGDFVIWPKRKPSQPAD
jgi:hypothetical protein